MLLRGVEGRLVHLEVVRHRAQAGLLARARFGVEWDLVVGLGSNRYLAEMLGWLISCLSFIGLNGKSGIL